MATQVALNPDQHHPAARRFYFVSEAAAELRRSEAAVRWQIAKGTIKTGKIAGRVVISAAELDRIIDGAFEEAS